MIGVEAAADTSMLLCERFIALKSRIDQGGDMFLKSIRAATAYNDNLQEFIASLGSDGRDATSLEDMENIAKKIERGAQKTPFKHKHTRTHYFLALYIVILFVLWMIYSSDGSYWGNTLLYLFNFFSIDHEYRTEIWALSSFAIGGALLVGVVVAGLMLFNAYFSKGELGSMVSSRLLLKSHLINNNLTAPGYSGDALRHDWHSRFMGFNRGDESQYIDRYFKGRFEFEGNELDYELFRYSYVVVSTRTVTTYNSITKKNETKTVTVRTSYYRYGLIMPFPHAKGLCISGEDYTYPQGWSSSSEEFNDLFKVTGDTVFTCAKVLQPSVVLALTDKLAGLGGMTLEINRQSSLCLSCTNRWLLPYHGDEDIFDTDEFLQALRNPETNHTLKHALDGIRAMIKFNDSNFEQLG